MTDQEIKVHIDLPCLPLTEFWQEGLEDINMTSFVRDMEGHFWIQPDLDKLREFKNLLVTIKEGARFEGEELVFHIDSATCISDLVMPIALELKEVFTSKRLIEKHKPFRRPEDLVFESITIEENNVVNVFFGS